MSEVNFLQCVICNPEFKDVPTRKTVVATSQELAALVMHIIENHVHYTVEQVLSSQAEILLRLEYLEKLARENPTKIEPNLVPPRGITDARS